jgi:hypothetical protein
LRHCPIRQQNDWPDEFLDYPSQLFRIWSNKPLLQLGHHRPNLFGDLFGVIVRLIGQAFKFTLELLAILFKRRQFPGNRLLGHVCDGLIAYEPDKLSHLSIDLPNPNSDSLGVLPIRLIAHA